MQYPKTKRETDKRYLEYIRTLPCRVCLICPSDAHHTVSVGAGGSDFRAIPLCRKCHSECHSIGAKTFQDKYALDFKEETIELLIIYTQNKRG